jgi:hypothetical protein
MRGTRSIKKGEIPGMGSLWWFDPGRSLERANHTILRIEVAQLKHPFLAFKVRAEDLPSVIHTDYLSNIKAKARTAAEEAAKATE